MNLKLRILIFSTISGYFSLNYILAKLSQYDYWDFLGLITNLHLVHCGLHWVVYILSNTKNSNTRVQRQQTPTKDGSDTGRKGEKNIDSVAVALEYNADSEFAPKVVAGGRGKVAEQILRIAFDRGIKVREDADLAEMLSAIDIDSEIPVNAFAAVAEILNYVYLANGDMPDFIKDELEKEYEHFEQNHNINDIDKSEETPWAPKTHMRL